MTWLDMTLHSIAIQYNCIWNCSLTNVQDCTWNHLTIHQWHIEPYNRTSMAHGAIQQNINGTWNHTKENINDTWNHATEHQWHMKPYDRTSMAHGTIRQNNLNGAVQLVVKEVPSVSGATRPLQSNPDSSRYQASVLTNRLPPCGAHFMSCKIRHKVT